MAPTMPRHDASLLQAALVGYQHELARIQAAIAVLQQRLRNHSTSGNTGVPTSNAATATRKRHRISPKGRARIAAAQRKRWAQARKSQGVVKMEPTPVKRVTAKKKVTHRPKAAKRSVRKTPPKPTLKSWKQAASPVPPAPGPVPTAEGQESGSGKKE
jgi:hypothetical protein